MTGINFDGIDPKDAATMVDVRASDLVVGRTIEATLRLENGDDISFTATYSMRDATIVFAHLSTKFPRGRRVRISSVKTLMRIANAKTFVESRL